MAGQASALVGQDDTEAHLNHTEVTGSTRNVSVTAQDTTTVTTTAGALGVGVSGFGVGAGASLAVFHDTVAAVIDDSDVTASGTVSVTADSNKAVQLISLAGGVGASAGIGGAAGLIMLGSGDSGKAMKVLNKNNSGTLSKQSQVSDAGNSTQGDGNLSSSESKNLGKATRFDLLGAVTATVPDATTATVSGGKVTAGQLNVYAADTTSTENVAGALGLSLGVGVGASVAVTRVYDSVDASIDNAQVTVSGGVQVNASVDNGSPLYKENTGRAVDVAAYAGGGGLGLGLGAAIADGGVDNTVDATITGGSLSKPAASNPPSVSIQARDGESVRARGFGAAVGLAAVGVVSATALKNSEVTSSFGSNMTDFGALSLDASAAGAVIATAQGSSGGIVSGNGAVANANDNTNVTAQTSDGGVQINGATTNGVEKTAVTIIATSSPMVSATADGVNVGELSVGVSDASAGDGGSVTAQLGNSTHTADLASLTLLAEATPTVTSSATSGEGALIGVQGVTSTANNTVAVTADTGSDVVLQTTGGVGITAIQAGAVTADGYGVLGGLAVAGAVSANAKASPDVTATLGPQASSGSQGVGGVLAVVANGTDSLSVYAKSGAGGALVENAASADTQLNASTIAQTKGTNGTLVSGVFDLQASHTAKVARSEADSTNVSLAGGGAGSADNTINSTVKTIYGAGTTLQAGSAVITADNRLFQPVASGGWNANGRAGGFANYNSISAQTKGTFITQVLINGGQIDVVGNPAQPSDHSLTIGTDNVIDATVSAKVATGGAVQGLTAKANFDLGVDTGVNSVDVAKSAALSATGNVRVYSGTNSNILSKTLAHTWGGAGYVDSNASATLQDYQTINIAGTVTSDNTVLIGAGYDANGGMNSLSVMANSHAYNDTVLALHTHPSATVTLTNHNQVNVPGSVLAGGNAKILVMRGERSLAGTAIGQNTYQKVVQAVANFFGGLINDISHAFGGKTVVKHVSLKYHGGSSHDDSLAGVNISGIVKAGLAGNQSLTLQQGTGGTVVRSSDSSALIPYSTDTWNYYQVLQDEKTRLQNEENNTNNTQLKGRLAFEITRLQTEINDIPNVTAAKNEPRVTLGPIYVRSGNVTITADPSNTHITGTVTAVPVSGVTIKNETPAFLRVGDITVDAGSGGQVNINGQITHTGGGSTPSVSIDSTFAPSSGSSLNPPDIFLEGTIDNPTGAVTVQDSQGSIHDSGEINAASVTIAALNGGYFQGYEPGYHAPGNNTTITTPGSIIAGGPVFVAAQYLDVNGLIQSGHDTLSVKLPSSLDATLSQWQQAYNKGTTQWNAYIKKHNLPVDKSTGFVQLTPSASIKNPNIIPAFWDPNANNIVLNPAKSQPGRVYLYGNIFNTGPSSKIVAADGLANITVNNQTNLPIIETGLDAGNANTGGLVQIVDTAKTIKAPDRAGKASEDKAGTLVPWSQATEYRYDPQSGQMTEYKFAEGAPGVSGKADATTKISTTQGANVQYNIANNGGGVWYVPSTVLLPYLPTLKFYALSAGLHRPSSTTTIPWSGLAKQSPSAVYNAANPIAIQFVGQSHGHITVTSPSGLWLKGDVSNPTGPVSLSAANATLGVLSSTALVKGQNITLTGQGGVGNGVLDETRTWQLNLPSWWHIPPVTITTIVNEQQSHPLNVQLVGDLGSLQATSADGNIDLVDSTGGLVLQQVSAQSGFVSIAAQGSLVGSANAADPTLVSGGNLTLAAGGDGVHGAVGMTDPMSIAAGGTVAVQAPSGVVDLSQAKSSGDLSVGQIIAGSNVTLNAPGGSIVSALSQTLNQKAVTQLEKQWSSFGLTGNGATNEGQDNLKALQSDFNAAYKQYWALKDTLVFSGSGSSLAIKDLTTAGYSDYQKAAAAFRGYAVDSPKLTHAVILDYVQKKLGSFLLQDFKSAQQQLGQLTTQYGLAASTVNPLLSQNQPTQFSKTVTNGIQATVTNGVAWTTEQLLNTVPREQVFGSAPALHSQAPNIQTTGTITLNAGQSVSDPKSGKLGAVTDPIQILLPTSNTATLELTPTQAAALAAATPGDISVNGHTITITQYHPVYEQGASRVDAATQNGLYLTVGSGDLNVGTLTNPQGEIRLTAQGSVLQASGGLIKGGQLGSVLHATSGSIGSSTLPVQLALTGPLDSAKASGGVYLDQTQGSLALGNLYSGTTASLTVDQGNLSSIFPDASVAHVNAAHLILDVAGSAGAGAPLALSLGSEGVSGQVGGELDLVSPTADLAVNNLTVGGAVSLDALLGNLSLNALASRATNGTAVTLNAGQAITGTSPSGADVAATGTGAEVKIAAGKGIGTPSRHLILDTPIVTSASTEHGGIYLTDLEGISASSIHAPGAINLTIDGNLAFGDVLAGKDIALSAQGGIQGSHLATTGGTITGQAGGDIYITTVDSPDSVMLTAPQGSIRLGTLTTAKANLGARDAEDIHQAWIDDLIAFHTQRLQAHVNQPTTASQDLQVKVGGWQGGLAQQVGLTFDTPHGVHFNPLHVGQAHIAFAQDDYHIDNGFVGTAMELVTPESTILMDNHDTTLRHVDIQFYQPRQGFFLYQQGRTSYTDAFTEHYKTGYKITVPNYIRPHTHTPLGFGGASADIQSALDARNGTQVPDRLLKQVLWTYESRLSSDNRLILPVVDWGVNVTRLTPARKLSKRGTQ